MLAFPSIVFTMIEHESAQTTRLYKFGDATLKIPAWTLHDLRRTARSLMSRAGIRPDIAERVLGHAIPGVESVYDRHSYAEEKAEALGRLAALIETIINPPQGNVLPLRR